MTRPESPEFTRLGYSPLRRDLVRGGPWWVNILVLLAVLIPLYYVGQHAIFTHLSGVDDEGYVLIGLREFVDGDSLYGDVYSQYGPALFVLVGAPLGLLDALDTDGAKWVQLLIWLSTSLLAGLTLLRISRNIVVAAAGLGVAFLVLSVDVGEALHPGGSMSLLLAGVVAAAAFLLPERPRAALFAMGACATAAALMKANVGGLALIAIAFALVITGERLGARRGVRTAACAALALVPFALLSADLSEDWGLRLAVVVAIAALAAGVAAGGLPPSRVDLEGRWSSLAAGIGGVLVLVLGVAIATGSSPSDLARGIVLDPLEFDDLVFFQIHMEPLGPLWGAAWLAAAGLYRWKLAPREDWSARETMLVGAVTLAAGIAIWLALTDVPVYRGLTRNIWLAAPLAWIAAVRPPTGREDTSFLRALVPALAVLELLHAYPVASSQLGWGSFPLVFAGGICIADGIERLAAYGGRRGAEPAGWRLAATACVLVFGVWLALFPLRDTYRDSRQKYDSYAELALPGAEQLRIRPAQAAQFREAAADLDRRCDGFISFPGFNSMHVWTGIDPPTGLTAGAWPWLLDDERQQRVVDEIDDKEEICVLQSLFVLTFWHQLLGTPDPGPLQRYIQDNFVIVKRYPGFPYQGLQLLKRRGSNPS